MTDEDEAEASVSAWPWRWSCVPADLGVMTNEFVQAIATGARLLSNDIVAWHNHRVVQRSFADGVRSEIESL